MSETNGLELVHKYRPQKLSQVVGQPEAVACLSNLLKEGRLPHTLLLTGPRGTGKSSCARILAHKIGCDPNEIRTINCADERGIDDARFIIESSSTNPMFGNCRVFICEECHHWSSRKGADAQTTLLDRLEHTGKKNYFFLTTTHPDDLLPTLRDRCTEVRMKLLSEEALTDLAYEVAQKEARGIEEAIAKAIGTAAQGSARKALELLHRVIGLADADQQLRLLTVDDPCATVDELVALLWRPGVKWPEMARLLSSLPKDEDWEAVRWRVLGLANAELKHPRGNWKRAYLLILACKDPWYGCKSAGLTAALYEVFSSEK